MLPLDGGEREQPYPGPAYLLGDVDLLTLEKELQDLTFRPTEEGCPRRQRGQREKILSFCCKSVQR